jgi:hypothetical protein
MLPFITFTNNHTPTRLSSYRGGSSVFTTYALIAIIGLALFGVLWNTVGSNSSNTVPTVPSTVPVTANITAGNYVADVIEIDKCQYIVRRYPNGAVLNVIGIVHKGDCNAFHHNLSGR